MPHAIGTSGSFGPRTTIVSTTPYAVLASDQMVVFKPSSATLVGNLPVGTTNTTYLLTHGNDSIFDVQIVPNGAQTIGGQTGLLLTRRQSVTLTFDGTEWQVT